MTFARTRAKSRIREMPGGVPSGLRCRISTVAVGAHIDAGPREVLSSQCVPARERIRDHGGVIVAAQRDATEAVKLPLRIRRLGFESSRPRTDKKAPEQAKRRQGLVAFGDHPFASPSSGATLGATRFGFPRSAGSTATRARRSRATVTGTPPTAPAGRCTPG
jgi:hypothetical protein